MRQAVRATVPVRSGATKAAIKVRAGKRKRGVARINVSISAGDYKGDTFYAAMEEFGHKIGSRALGDSRKQYPGSLYMQRAYDEAGPSAKAEAMRVILG